ncbi:MAG: MFS transporter [Gammaproteobacteria bacterium]|nr:MFS transporter [Gammaproteobacteria bacterium]
MTTIEKRAASSLAAIFAFRMLGLFMILPVFVLYAEDLHGVTPVKVGLAIGIYGLTQALFQIPFGMLSDRFGRKPLLLIGLIIFAIGSVIAGYADTIDGVILGRAIQGAGAVAAVILALLADLTSEEHRTKAMAFIGMSIGFSFIGAMVLGPFFSHFFGVHGLFYITALMAVAGIVILYLLVPDPPPSRFHRDTTLSPTLIGHVLRNRQLLRLDFGIFVLHLTLTASFMMIPLKLRELGLEEVDTSLFYLPVMVLAMVMMVPLIIIGEKWRRLKEVFLLSIVTLLLVVLAIALGSPDLWWMAVLLCIYFTAFNLLEASLPSLISKFSPVTSKGTAMGLYTSSQFLGAFTGGALGGVIYGLWGEVALLSGCAALLLIWALLALTMESPRYLVPRLVNIGQSQSEDEEHQLFHQISAIDGVVEVTINGEEGIAYLKVDSQHLDEAELFKYSVKAT